MQNKKSIYEALNDFYQTSTEESFQFFYLELYKLALHTAFYITKNHADAEDITQQSFLVVFRKINVCQSINEKIDVKIKSWFLSIVYNQSKMHLRQKTRSAQREKGISRNNCQNGQEEQLMNQDENSIKFKKLQDAIECLPEKYRTPIILKYKEGMENQSIAEILQMNQSTLRNRISRGIQQLKTVLFKNENEIEEILPSIAFLPLFGLSNQVHPPLFNSKAQFNVMNSKRIFLNQSIIFVASAIFATTVILSSVFYYKFNSIQKPEILNGNEVKYSTFKFKLDYTQGELNNTEVKIGSWSFQEGFRIPEPEKDIYIQFNEPKLRRPCRIQVIGGTVVQSSKFNFDYAVQGAYFGAMSSMGFKELYFKKRNRKSTILNAKNLNKEFVFQKETATIIFIDNLIITEYQGKICKIIQTEEDPHDFNKIGLILNSFGVQEIEFESLPMNEQLNYRNRIVGLVKK
jgi:RNA polymerase sigma-70 factor (ECF subfamily)